MKNFFSLVAVAFAAITLKAEAINVAQALEIASQLEQGASTTEVYEVEGYVTALQGLDDGGWAKYGNQNFWIADDKENTAISNADGALLVYAGVAPEQVYAGDKISVITTLFNDLGNLRTRSGAEVTILEKVERPETPSEKDADIEFTGADFIGQGISSVGGIVTATKNGVTFTCDKAFNDDDHEILRCYRNGTIKITSEKKIYKLTFQFFSTYTGDLQNEVVVNAKEWSYTLTNQARIEKLHLHIYYYDINLSTQPLNAGTTQITDYTSDRCILNTNPNTGYHFTQWSDGDTNNPRTIVLTQDTAFTAEFALNKYNVNVTCDGEHGVIEGENGEFDYLTEHTYTAIPKYGYHFTKWSESKYVCTSWWNNECYNGYWEGITDNPRTITVTQDTTIFAIFEPNSYNLYALYNVEQGFVEGKGLYPYLSNCSLKAIPNEGYHFTQWSDGNTDNPRTIVLTQDTTFTAEFEINTSGLCGDDLVWSLTDNVLTIIGKGTMWDDQPWKASCKQITQVNLPQGLTTIGNRAFEYCSSLKEIRIPNSVYYIGNYAFNGCDNIESLECPAVALSAIPQNKIQSIIINGGRITDSYFNSGLKRLDLAKADNTKLLPSLFYGFVDLKELKLPANLEYIDYMTFAGCLELKGIVIPASVKEIDRRAFEDCRSLSSLSFEEGSQLTTIDSWAFYNCHELAKIDLPEGVEEIGKAAFYGCAYAQEVHLPASVKAIGDNGFALCSKIKQMNVDAVLPPEVENKTFYEVSTEAPVYVPDLSVSSYKSHPVWGKLNIVGRSDAPTAVDNVQGNNTKATKILRDGQIYILRNGTMYNIQGNVMK